MVSLRSRRSCLRHLTSWACGSSNDGTADDRITFVATPYDANDILKQLKYTNLEPNIIDTITVSVFDGSGGLCIDEEDHTTPSVRLAEGEEVCLTSRLSFNITVDTFSFQKVSERSDRALTKTSILAINPAKWLQTATSTTKLTHPICSARSPPLLPH